MEMLLKEISYATRMLRRNLGLTAVAVLTLALGISACTAIFSVVHAVLIRPLPYAHADRLVLVWGELRMRSVNDWPLSPPHFQDLRRQTTGFEALAALTPAGRTAISGDGSAPEQIRVASATPNLFSVLGVHISLGRDFVEADGIPQAPPGPALAARQPPLPAIAILSDGFWKRRYGADARVVGQTIAFGDAGQAQIVGVLPPDFEILFSPRVNVFPTPDMWVAERIDFDGASRNSAFMRVVGRLKPGVTFDQAEREVERVAADIRERFPISGGAGLHFHVVPMHEDLVREVRPAIVTLMCAVLFVLLISCANVANLLIVRASSRTRELALRSAIGGSRWRLVRQLLVESGLIAGGGTLLGLFLAHGMIRGLLRLGPASLPRLDAVALDPVVLGFTAAAGALTAIACGIVPALRASRPDLMEVLRQSGGSGLRGGTLARRTMVTVEVALSFVLLIGSGLMLRTFVEVQRIDLGYDATGVLTFLLPASGTQPAERALFVQRVRDRLRAIPGVESVSAASPLPLDGQLVTGRWGPETAAADTTLYRQADARIVLPGYFETLRTRLIEGRTFTEADNARTDATLIILDDQLAAKAFPNRSAIGQRILARIRTPEPEVFEVIGVVAHQRHAALSAAGPDCMFFTDGLLGSGAAGRWAVRTSGEPAEQAGAIRAAIAEVAPNAALAELQPMTDFVDRAAAPTRFTVVLIALFGGIAVLLAAVGLYGVLATTVRQRTAEIGMRTIFGAPRRSIFALIIGEGLRCTAVGIAIGCVLAIGVTRWMASLLVGVEPTDPLTFAGTTGLFLLIATLACWLPAYRAARLDPAVALREE